MDDDTTLRTIGDLARLTGLPVKTIRYWSDAGVVPPTDRTPVGYRLYDRAALDRLGLVRTLRDLGIDLAAIRRILRREITVAEVAAAHAEALEVQIRTLRMRQAVLRTVAGRGSSPQETALMHRLATLSDRERRRLVEEFIDHTVEGIDADPAFVAMMRDAVPVLPEDATAAQVDAWVELAELVRDEGFRAAMRRAVADQSRTATVGDTAAPPDAEDLRSLAALLRGRAGGAAEAGTDPGSAEARPVVGELVAAYARLTGRRDDAGFPRLAAGAAGARPRRALRAVLAARRGGGRAAGAARPGPGRRVVHRCPAGPLSTSR
ncbi:MerR family transcriptional regulator [Streptomyces sp. NPDC058691]|uniref:helix-turn-helix domain-containing protein n=1 Tax=Streptomyces sp. NPDC058691 TaxID=3346601 RepID=UPI0036489ABE